MFFMTLGAGHDERLINCTLDAAGSSIAGQPSSIQLSMKMMSDAPTALPLHGKRGN